MAAVSLLVPVLLVAVNGGSLAQASGLDALRAKGYVRICADPGNLRVSSAQEEAPGFEVALARLIAHEIGVEARFHWILTWVKPFWALRKSECDIFMGLPLAPRFLQANRWIAVSRPHYTMHYAILARVDAAIVSVNGMAGKRIAVDAGRPAE